MERAVKGMVVAWFEVLPYNLPCGTGNKDNTSVKISSLWTQTVAWYPLTVKQECYTSVNRNLLQCSLYTVCATWLCC